jgi:hypothetical protein
MPRGAAAGERYSEEADAGRGPLGGSSGRRGAHLAQGGDNSRKLISRFGVVRSARRIARPVPQGERKGGVPNVFAPGF